MERYENLGVVGEGSYGVVLKCRHRETGQIVAVKKFLEGEDDPSVKKIALREVRMLKRLRHENLINLIEFFRRKRRLYLVFEYVDHTVLEELEEAGGGLPEATARAYIFQVLRGIAFCHHNQIIHRDVKPENVLVSRLGVVKLCDFGFARLATNPGEVFTDYVATRWYRAPELLVGDTRYGKEVDVWAIGCLLAEMLTADPLFPGESDIDQLFHIIQALGELSAHHQTLVERNPMMAGLHLPAAASTPLQTTYPMWSPRSLTFIKACLSLIPTERPSAQTLLAHDFFLHDSFPDMFLPELRHKVQQEFSGNALLSKDARRGSGGSGMKKSKKGKGGVSSPEAIYGRSVAHAGPSSKIDIQPRRSSTKTVVNTNLPISMNNRTGHYYGINFIERKGINVDDGPPSLPLSTMPPLRDSNNANYSSISGNINFANNLTFSNNTNYSNNSNYTTMTTFPNTISYIGRASIGSNNSMSNVSNKSSFSGSPTKAVSLGLSINALSSPSRGSDRGTKSPMHNNWDPSIRHRGPTKGTTFPSTVDSRRQRSNSTPDDDDLNLNLAQLLHETALPSATATRQYPFEIYRNPYTISLDQTKESASKPAETLSQKDFHCNSRDNLSREQLSKDQLNKEYSGRDPLREIKSNSRESGRPMKQEPQEVGLRRPRMDIAGWVKSKFVTDDLSLPNVPGVVGTSLGSTSKSQRVAADDSSATGSGRNRGKGGGVSMPALGAAHRTPGTSIPRLQSPQLPISLSYDVTTTASPKTTAATIATNKSINGYPVQGTPRKLSDSSKNLKFFGQVRKDFTSDDDNKIIQKGYEVTSMNFTAPSNQEDANGRTIRRRSQTEYGGFHQHVSELPRPLGRNAKPSQLHSDYLGWNKELHGLPSRASASAEYPSSSGGGDFSGRLTSVSRGSVSADAPVKPRKTGTKDIGSADSVALHGPEKNPLPEICGQKIPLFLYHKENK